MSRPRSRNPRLAKDPLPTWATMLIWGLSINVMIGLYFAIGFGTAALTDFRSVLVTVCLVSYLSLAAALAWVINASLR